MKKAVPFMEIAFWFVKVDFHWISFVSMVKYLHIFVVRKNLWKKELEMEEKDGKEIKFYQ